MAWTIRYKSGNTSVEKSFTELGLSKLSRRTRARQPDVVQIDDEGTNLDADPLFAFDDEIEIWKDGVRWFAGRVKDAQRQGSGESESMSYEVEGVLGWLNDLIFRQPWNYVSDFSDPKSSLKSVYVSNLVLFQKLENGVAVFANIREQIQEIFSYIISKWTEQTDDHDSETPKFQLDDSKIPTFQVPFMEVRNISCALALEYCFEMIPDASMCVDYSTDIPTVHIAQRGITSKYEAAKDNYLQVVTMTIPEEGEGNKSPILSVDIRQKSELKVPCVAISYLQSNSINGASVIYQGEDVYPLGADVTAFRVLPQIVDLRGSDLSFPQAVMSTRTIDITTIDFWKLHDTSLGKANVINLKVREPSRNGTLPYEVLVDSDPWAPWMGGNSQEDVFEAFVDYDVTAQKSFAAGPPSTVVVEQIRNQLVTFRLMTTDIKSGSYQGPVTGTIGEPVPIGLAQALYEAIAEPAFEGSLTLDEDEVSGLITVGNVVNLTCKSRPEWGTARMMVYETTEEVDTGKTTVTFGPQQRLDVSKIMDWMRGLRRNNQGFWASRSSGLNYSGGPQRVAARAHKDTALASKESRERIMLVRADNQVQTPETLTAKVEMDILDVKGKQLKFHEWAICVDGVKYYAMILSSGIYTTPVTAQPLGANGILDA